MLKKVFSLVIILSMIMTLFMSFPIATAAEGELTDNLVLWYKFDETEGTVVTDSSGNNNNGTLSGDATWTEGKIDGSVRLGNSDGYVSLPSGIVSNLDDITIAMWVRMERTNSYQRLFDFGTGTSVNMFLTPTGGNEGAMGLAFAITTSGWQEEERMEKGTNLDTDVWKHVAVVLSGNTGIIYEDGVEVGRNDSMTLNPSDLGNTTNNYIGRSQYSSDPYFRGNFDDFRIYSKALSAAQIKELYEPSIPPENEFVVNVEFNADSITPNKMLQAKVTVQNNSDYEGPALVIMALYDDDQRMVNVSYISKTIPSQGTESLNAGFKLPANVEGYKVKVFVWEGEHLATTNMEPLSDVVILE